ncbi:MAG: ATP-binding cassette domain-containing protein [Planctomycetes bacterium]|nr:ATP-binding cassette domain-containing protein [Planctomycetota bacterium]
MNAKAQVKHDASEGSAARILLKDVRKAFPNAGRDAESADEILVLDGINVDVDQGEVVAVVGPNGCGKTTLLNLIAGLLEADAGDVTLDGKRSESVSVAYVFQNFRETLLPWRTAEENVALPLELAGARRVTARATAREFLRRHAPEVSPRAFPYTLSGGQQQLVAIARAIVSQAPVVLLDEPFNQLDSQYRCQVRARFLDLWASKAQTTILVTHDVEDAILCSQRLLVLSRRPARVLREIRVPLTWPRTDSAVHDELFSEVERTVLQLLRGERS